jgi:predicted permease
MAKLVFSLSIISFGLALGYIIQILAQKGTIKLPITLEKLRKLLQKIALLFFNPIAFLGAIWIIKIDNLRIVALPFIGVFALLLGGVLALAAAKFFHLTRKEAGSLYTCGSFTNIGSIGGLVCFLFLGETGFAFVPFYKLFEEVVYYAIGFPIAKFYSTEAAEIETTLSRIKKVFTDIFVVVALTTIFLGAILNYSGLERPDFYRTINYIFIPLATVLLLTSIGMAMRFKSIKSYLRECISVSVIKFILVPLSVCTLALLIGYKTIEGGLPLKVVLILSCMPVAFTALVPPSLYNLNLDLANSCWLCTTSSLVIVLPLLLYVIRLI